MASIRSRITANRFSNGVPWFSTSGRFHPPPTPNRKRPPDSRSRLATCLAVTKTSRCATRQMPVASFRRVVACAAIASDTKGSAVR